MGRNKHKGLRIRLTAKEEKVAKKYEGKKNYPRKNTKKHEGLRKRIPMKKRSLVIVEFVFNKVNRDL
jgi:hypothetical protein